MAMTSNERVYMVVGEDENGDHHLFASDDLDRALPVLREMKKRLTNVRANWEAVSSTEQRDDP